MQATKTKDKSQNTNLAEQYNKAISNASGMNPFFSDQARQQMADMVEIIAQGNANLDAINATNQSATIKGGFAAEEFHAETYNLDAALKGDKGRAMTDRYEDWSKQEWQGRNLGKNDIPDVVVTRDGKISSSAQSKYYSTAEHTAQEMSQVKDGQVKYKDCDRLIGPEDQINAQEIVVAGESEPVKTTTVSEHAEAKAAALETKGGDAAEIDAYKQTAKKAKATLEDGKASSSTLTKDEANKLGENDRSKLKDIENQYQTKSTLQQMGNAAVGAAAMSAVISGASNTVKYIQLAREGKCSVDEAVCKIAGETVAAAADSAVKAAANVGAQSLLVRYGSKEVAKQVLAKQGAMTLLKSNAVTVGVVCAIDAIKDLVRFGMGDISKDEFYERQGKNLLSTSAGLAGAHFGAAGATAAASALGVSAGSTAMAALSFAGGMAGGLIAGVALSMAIENGIEKPYHDLVRNTNALHDAARELERLSQNMLMGQVLFTKFLEQDIALEYNIKNQLARNEAAGARARAAIDRI